MPGFLFAEKAPFFVTVFVAAAGWVLSHTSERFMESPVIEYQTRLESPQGKPSRYSVRLCNLSRQTSFADLQFVLSIPPSSGGGNASTLDNPTVAFEPPGMDIQSQPVTSKERDTVRFLVRQFQPGACMVMAAEHAGPVRPVFRLMSSKEPVYLKERSLETLYIAYETRFLLAGLLAWGILMLAIGNLASRRRPGSPGADPMDYK